MTTVLRSSLTSHLFRPCIHHLILKRFYNLPPEMQPIIGLEIHAQLNTKQKLFSCILSRGFYHLIDSGAGRTECPAKHVSRLPRHRPSWIHARPQQGSHLLGCEGGIGIGLYGKSPKFV